MSGLNISRLYAAVGLVAAAGLATGPAGAAERTPAEVAAWVAANTDIAPAQIAIVTSEYVYGFEALGPMTATGEALALVRTEAFAVKAGAARGVQSWEAHLLFDCRGGRMRLIRSADYRERNRAGSPIAMEETAGWQTPSAGEPASQLLAAACDATFAWPLRASKAPLAIARSEPIPPSLPIVVSNQTAQPPESAPPAASPAASLAGYAIQIGRGPSSEGARKALRLARRTLGAEGASLAATTEHSRLGVRHRFTAVLSGFPTEAAANRACATLHAADQACFLRATAAPEPSPAAPFQGGYAVQLAYGPSKEGAVQAVRRAKKALGAQAAALEDVSEVSADGSRHTALLGGFETLRTAARACEVLQRAQLSCLARPTPLAPLDLAAR